MRFRVHVAETELSHLLVCNFQAVLAAGMHPAAAQWRSLGSTCLLLLLETMHKSLAIRRESVRHAENLRNLSSIDAPIVLKGERQLLTRDFRR